ncbi:MAG: hypothetical protein AB8B61_05370 [Cyclobacteriaceae bacterium]
MNSFSFYYSSWLILPALLLSGIASWVLYKKREIEPSLLYRLAIVLRFVIFFFLFLLLIEPIIRQLTNVTVPAKIIIGIDNSSSLKDYQNNEKLQHTIQKLYKDLEAKKNKVELVTLNGRSIAYDSLASLPFNNSSTDLTAFLNEVKSNQQAENTAAVILLSDGILTSGTNPTYLNYPFPIHTIALGDTNKKKDIVLQKVVSNRKIQPKSTFSVQLSVEHRGFSNRKTELRIELNGKVIQKKEITFSSTEFTRKELFIEAPNKEGFYNYRFSLSNQAGEFSKINNQKELIVEVVNSKTKILLAAATPHPDIKALRAILSKVESNEVSVFVASRGDKFKTKAYDLVIYHQLPHKSKIGDQVYRKLKSMKIPSLSVFTDQTAANTFTKDNTCLTYKGRQTGQDQVTSSLNTTFSTFQLEYGARFSSLPPISVPFGNYKLKSGAKAVLYQQIGSVVTERPLLSINLSRTVPSAVFVGNGLWLWRLNSYKIEEENHWTDELIVKTGSLLVTRKDNERFVFQPQQRMINETERPIFDALLYNSLYERVPEVSVTVSFSKQGDLVAKEEKVLTSYENSLVFNRLPVGNYQYTASVTQDDSLFRQKGLLIVKKTDLEATHTTANHGLLRQLSEKTAGEYSLLSSAEKLSDVIETKGTIQTKERMQSSIHLKWIFFVIILLIGTEWTIRKWHGSI